MLLTNVLTIAALTTFAMAGYDGGHPTNGEFHAANNGEKAPADEPAHHFAAREDGERVGFYAKEGADSRKETHTRPSSKLSTRNGGVYWCSKDNWKGSCTKSNANNSCHKWDFGPSGSFGPDPGVKCTFYDHSDCTGESTSVSYPGSGEVYFFGSHGVTYVPFAWKCHT